MGTLHHKSTDGERWQPMKQYYVPHATEVKQVRISSKLTQSQASEIVCVTPTTWARWETNKCAMPAGLWKLFNNEVNQVKTIPDAKNELKSIVDDWTEDNPYD